MKTVQERLQELDTEELIDSYLAQKMLRKEMVRAMQTRDNIEIPERNQGVYRIPAHGSH